MVTKKTVALILLTGFSFILPVNAQCGNCRPNGFSLLYGFVPGSVQRFTNPVLRANQVANTVRNPYLLLSPCNPVTRTATNLINTNVRGALVNSNNSYTASYIPGNYNPQINQNAFVSGFNGNTNIDSGTSYFDSQTNSYVWVLPDN